MVALPAPKMRKSEQSSTTKVSRNVNADIHYLAWRTRVEENNFYKYNLKQLVMSKLERSENVRMTVWQASMCVKSVRT